MEEIERQWKEEQAKLLAKVSELDATYNSDRCVSYTLGIFKH